MTHIGGKDVSRGPSLGSRRERVALPSRRWGVCRTGARSVALSALVAGAALACGAAGKAAPAPGWSPDVRLTFDSAPSRTSYNFAHAIAADAAGRVFVVWFRPDHGVSQVFLKRSLDGGTTWGADTPLSQSTRGAEYPAIAAAGSDVYVVWHDFRHGQPDILLRHSSDHGTSWGPEQLLTPGPADGSYPSVAASGRRVRIVYEGIHDGQTEVYTRGSDDQGATWSAEARLSSPPYTAWTATVELAGPHAYVGWVDYRDANEEEYFRRSTDGGTTWGPITRLTHDPADSWAPSLAVEGQDIFYFWFDRRDAGITDAAVEHTLDQATALVGLPVHAAPPRSAAVYYLPPFEQRLQEKLHAIRAAAPGWVGRGGDARRLAGLLGRFEHRFQQWTLGWDIYYKHSGDGGATWGPDIRLTRGRGFSMRPSAAMSGKAIHVVWFDSRDGQTEVYYKYSATAGRTWGPDQRLTSAAGNPLGDTMHPSLAVAGRFIYVVWYDQRLRHDEIFFKRAVLTPADPPPSALLRSMSRSYVTICPSRQTRSILFLRFAHRGKWRNAHGDEYPSERRACPDSPR